MTASVEQTLAKINTKYGGGAAVVLGDKPIEDIDVISTGSIALNNALGVGGWPRGRIIEIMGNESTGKTTLLIHAMVEAQKSDEKLVGFVDMEQAFDVAYAEGLGLDLNRTVFSQPSSAEEAMSIVEAMTESGNFSIVILDSVAALVPQAEIEGDMGDSHIGLVARLMGQGLRKLTPKVKQTNTCLFFINQFRANVNTMGFGSPVTTTGGNALKFYASVRIDMRRKGGVKGKAGEEDLGNIVKVKVAKNKVAAPFKVCDMEVLFGDGFCPAQEALNIATKAGIVKQAGAWYSYGDVKFQGKEPMRVHLRETPEVLGEIIEQIIGE